VGDTGEKLSVHAETAVERVTGACNQALSKFPGRWLDRKCTGGSIVTFSVLQAYSLLFVFGADNIYFWNIRTAVRGGLGIDRSLKLCKLLAICTAFIEGQPNGETNASSLRGKRLKDTGGRK
jgi:hypothetical protein